MSARDSFKRMDITGARVLLGYEPRDDAFALVDAGLRD